jgi:hypothetical protein
VRSYFNLVTKNAVFMRSVAFRKRLCKKENRERRVILQMIISK